MGRASTACNRHEIPFNMDLVVSTFSFFSMAFGGKKRVIHPAHLLVEDGMKLLPFPIAEVVAAAEPVADAQKHVFD